MALTTGTRLGAYEIVSLLGSGGMGEVYRAHDTKLNRDVAIKVLLPAVANDPDRLSRFSREAQVLASLNHPNIGHIYGLEDAGSMRALVMELVGGPTLADRIAHGAIPLDEALPIAKQIAEALEAAHEHGIIHRDLKPANIKVRADGTVKVLDFGLAKAMDPPASSSVNAMNSPTLTAATVHGVILGTAAYMSPEQAAGKPVDKRSDLWAFGVVLMEMLTGRQVFDGETVSHVLAAVLTKEPEWTALPAHTPVPVRRLLRRCLEKDRKKRLGDASSARLEIDDALTATVDVSPAGVDAPPVGWRRTFPWAIAGTAVIAASAVVLIVTPWRSASPRVPMRLNTELGADVSLPVESAQPVVLSPDGSTVAFIALKGNSTSTQLYVRRLDQLGATFLSGTDGASDPFFSPDGRWVAFFAGGKLKKIAVAGGAAVTLSDAPNNRGGTWADDGTILFQPEVDIGVSMMRVPSAGGKTEPFVKPADARTSIRWPQVLPGGKTILYTAGVRGSGAFEEADLVVQPFPDGVPRILQHGGYAARYVASGHLVYLHEGTLFAAPFSIERLALTGQAMPVIEGVRGNTSTGGGQFVVSQSGTLLYVQSESAAESAPVQWMDRTGSVAVLRAVASTWSNPHFSPDGRRLAMDIFEGMKTDVWVYEWNRDTATKLAFDDRAEHLKPVWTPDGRRIVFASKRASESAHNLFWQHADGTGDVQRLTESPNIQWPASWHPSGKFLAFDEQPGKTQSDLMILPMSGDESSGWKPGTPTVFLSTPFEESEPMFSPDGQWIAYQSDKTGRDEVYVRPFPGPGGEWQVSPNGGKTPRWSSTRRELLYQGADNRIMVSSYVADSGSFRADKPRAWSERPVGQRRPEQPGYDLHPDGDRMAIAITPDVTQKNQGKVVIVFNFFDELMRIAPIKK